jgi:hypothetical protein
MANVFRGIGSRRFLTSIIALDFFLGEKISTMVEICGIGKVIIKQKHQKTLIND